MVLKIVDFFTTGSIYFLCPLKRSSSLQTPRKSDMQILLHFYKDHHIIQVWNFTFHGELSRNYSEDWLQLTNTKVSQSFYFLIDLKSLEMLINIIIFNTKCSIEFFCSTGFSSKKSYYRKLICSTRRFS